MGERAALHWLMGQGAHVSIPFGHSPHYDLVADLSGELLRVQVKTSVCRYKQRWAVTVCTRGGNQSWQGLVKRLDPTRLDYLFVLVADVLGVRGRPGRSDPGQLGSGRRLYNRLP